MPYVPGCSHDLFISYASENNRDGWVEQFVQLLGRELSELLGIRQFNPKESIFFDRRDLEVAQSFPDELIFAARESAVLVPILSPGYLTSPWCNRERKEFFSKLPSGAAAANCLAPILIRPVDETGLDPLNRNAQRMSFLSPDEQTPMMAGSPIWTGQVWKFAGQVKNALQKLRYVCKPVFVGRVADRNRSQEMRASCCTELARRHFRIVPEALPALDDPDRVRASLDEAGLAIHFLGNADAAALEAIETSVAVCTGPTIVYQPFATELMPTERLWLAEFERELDTRLGGYQRLADKNEQELLAVIDEQVKHMRVELPKHLTRSDLALVCEASDLDKVRQLKQDLQTSGRIEVDSPDFLGGRMKAMERLRKWQDYLSRSEALLFYYGTTESERLELIWQTAQHPGHDIPCDWYLAPPDIDAKRKKYPDALWNIDQVVRFLDRARSSQ